MRISDWSSDVCSSDLQGTEQLRLKGKRQFRNFVQEQRPTIGRLEQAVGRSRRARKCAFAMAEEHGLHHRFGQSRAVYRNEILVGPVAAHMNAAGPPLLSRSSPPLRSEILRGGNWGCRTYRSWW